MANNFREHGRLAETNRNAEGDTADEAASRINKEDNLEQEVTGGDVRKAEQGDPEYEDVLKALHRIYTT